MRRAEGRGVRVDDDDVAFFEVVDERVHVVQVDAAALVVAALAVGAGGLVRGSKDGGGGRRRRRREGALTNSSCRSKTLRALLMSEPRSLSIEDDILPNLKSLGLHGARGAQLVSTAPQQLLATGNAL